MMRFRNILKGLRTEQKEVVAGSTAILDNSIVESFINKSDNTFLVSFPRTGSHWLRMIMELYFNRPSLVRIFYYPENTNYLTLHTHDKQLDVERENVIYLYRDPVDTVYSQLNYYKEDIKDNLRIVYWAEQYGRHLDKWLHCETFTTRKTILTYEGMKRDMEKEFRKITGHFGEQLDRKKLADAVARITKEEVKNKTGHDPQVVQLKSEYETLRLEFRQLHSQRIWDTILNGRPYIKEDFAHMLQPEHLCSLS